MLKKIISFLKANLIALWILSFLSTPDAGKILMTEAGLEIRVGSILDHGASPPISSDSVTETVEDFTLSSPEFTFKLPGKIAKSLNSDQREGPEWLWSLHCKGENGFFGNMGFGKTLHVKVCY